MNIAKILHGLKGQVLDAAHFELLKHAYELQEENIRQLKTNNEALKESQKLLTEKLSALENDYSALESNVDEIRKNLPDPEVTEISDYAQNVLDAYKKADSTQMLKKDIASMSKMTNIQTESGIAELAEARYLRGTARRAGGILYSLSSSGKQLLTQE